MEAEGVGVGRNNGSVVTLVLRPCCIRLQKASRHTLTEQWPMEVLHRSTLICYLTCLFFCWLIQFNVMDVDVFQLSLHHTVGIEL